MSGLNFSATANILEFINRYVKRFSFQILIKWLLFCRYFFCNGRPAHVLLEHHRNGTSSWKISTCVFLCWSFVTIVTRLLICIVFELQDTTICWIRSSLVLKRHSSLRTVLGGLIYSILTISIQLYIQISAIAITWYLANDMQFFIISPIFILLLYYSLGNRDSTISGIMLFSIAVTGTLAGIENSNANMLANYGACQ